MHRDLKPVPLRGCSVGAFWVGKTDDFGAPKKGLEYISLEYGRWNISLEYGKISLEYGNSCKNIIEIWKTFDERSLLYSNPTFGTKIMAQMG